jgi:acetyl-CoA/propionyl-CoA carboxylase carboxyl transferase subunit
MTTETNQSILHAAVPAPAPVARPAAAAVPAVEHPTPSMLTAVADPGSLAPIDAYDGCGASAATATLCGRPVVLYATDGAVRGGALGSKACDCIVGAIRYGVESDLPVVGLWSSGGASLYDGVASLDGVGRVFAAIVAASGRIPQVSIIDGPAAGGAAYGPALTDVVVLTDRARVFVTGPAVVSEVTGQDVDALALGGPDQHARRSGVAHLCVETLEDAADAAAGVLELLCRPGTVNMDALAAERPVDPSRHVPAAARSVYNAIPLIDDLLDVPALVLQPRWAPNVVTALGRVGGRAVGVVANNPRRIGGSLDADAGDKAARFVRMCDAFGLPLVVVVDVPGYLPGESQERAGVLRRGAKLLHAFAAARVPRITVIVRKAFGGAFVAMNSRGLGATRVLAWPSAEVGVMNDRSAVRILHRRRLAAVPPEERPALEEELLDEHRHSAVPMEQWVRSGFIDAIVEPRDTRRALGDFLNTAPAWRGSLTNIPL